MNILVVIAHPNPESFNHAIAGTVVKTLKENGHDVIFQDLYAEKFDPVYSIEELDYHAELKPDVKMYCDALSDADGIVIVHPNWWGQPPAILKGWVDRVFRYGVAFEFHEDIEGEGASKGLLKADTAVVFNTSNTSEAIELGIYGDPLETLWSNCIMKFCGAKTFYRKMFRTVVDSAPERRTEWLAEVKDTINRYFSK
jgi:NAD(P)H dehydrogenase (quinone)